MSVQAINNNVGFAFETTSGTINAVAGDSIAARNSNYGFAAHSSAPDVSVLVIHSVTAHNTFGIADRANAALRLGQSTVTGNLTTLTNFGILQSFGDNYIAGNADDPAPPSPVISKR